MNNTQLSPAVKIIVVVIILALLGYGSYWAYNTLKETKAQADAAKGATDGIINAVNTGQLLQILSQQAANVQKCGKVLCE